jgi:mRNA interferase MazF
MGNLNMDKFRVERGHIFTADLGEENIVGSEQRGERPVIVLGNDAECKFSPTIEIAVITSKISKKKLPVHVEIGRECGLLNDSVILIEQKKTIDRQRIKSFVGKASDEVMRKVDDALEMSLSIGAYAIDAMNRVERIIAEKIDLIHRYEATLMTLKETGLLNDISARMLIGKREHELSVLKKFCELNEIAYMDRYKPYGYTTPKAC